MKCIKALRASKDVEVGDIKRVDDRTAYNMVGSSWAYIPKSEWKLATRKSKEISQVTEQLTEQEENKPYKKGQRSEKHKNKKS